MISFWLYNRRSLKQINFESKYFCGHIRFHSPYAIRRRSDGATWELFPAITVQWKRRA